MRQVGISGRAFAQAEDASLGATHAEVGARLLSRWGLPTNITLAVLHHHHSPYAAAPFERLAATIRLADHLAHYLTGGETAARDLAAGGPEAMALLQLAESDVPTLVEQTQERLRRVQEVLHITA